MEYKDLKKSIADTSGEILTLNRRIGYLENERLAQFDDIKKYVESEISSFLLSKSSPDIVEKEYEVVKRNAAGGWDESDKSATVVLKLKKTSSSNKYNYYTISEVIDDGGLKKYFKSQVAIVQQAIKDLKEEQREAEEKLSQYRDQIKNIENPYLVRYKEELLCLSQAQGSAISATHKSAIQEMINSIKNGSFDYRKYPGLWYTGAKQYVSNIIKRLGGKRYHKSGKSVSGSVYYNLPNRDSVRLTDHELPDTEQRRHNNSVGIGGDWIEVILVTPRPFAELKEDVLYTIETGLSKKELLEDETNSIKQNIAKLREEKEFGDLIKKQSSKTKISMAKSKKTGQKTLKGLLAKNKQQKPQSQSYSHKRDQEQKAKPKGWRFTGAGAVALKVSSNAKPTAIQIEMYKSKKTKSGDRYIYEEKRIDKSDVNQKQKFASGGEVHSKDKPGKLVFKADTKGGKRSIEVVQGEDGLYNVYKYTNGSQRSAEVSQPDKDRVVKGMREDLSISKGVSGINYIVSIDELGVGKEYAKGGIVHSKEKSGTLVFKADTKGGKYSIEARKEPDGLYHIYEYSNGNLSGANHNVKESDVANRLRDSLQGARADSINYIISIDELGVGKEFAKGGSTGDVDPVKEGLYFLWRTDHASYKDGKWVNTGNFKGSVNNSSGMYVSNKSADAMIDLANSEAKITEDELMAWAKANNKSATDYHKANKKFAEGGTVGDADKSGPAIRGVLMKYTLKNGKRVSEYSYATVAWHGTSGNRFKDTTPIKINTHFNDSNVHGKTFFASDVERFTLNSGKDKGFIIYVEFPVSEFKDTKGFKQITMSYVSNWLRPDMVGKAKGGEVIVNETFAKGGRTSNNDDSPKIYVADLAAYNEGKLIGEWLDLDDYTSGSEVMGAIHDLLKKWSADQGTEREEYAIHDIENIPKSLYSEGMAESSFDKIYAIKEAADSAGLPFEVIVQWMEDTGHDDASDAADAYQGKYDDMEDYAYRMVEDGVINDLSQYMMISETDRRILAGEEADSRLEDMSNEDMIRDANMEDEVEGLEEDSPEYEAIVSKARDHLHDEIYNEIYASLDDPINYFVEEQGMYSIEDLANRSFIQIDYEKLGRDLGYDVNEVEHDGKTYIFSSNFAKGGSLPGGAQQGTMFDAGGNVPGKFKREITLGKIDYNGTGRKVNEATIEIEIRNKENAIDWDTLEEVHNVPEVSMSARVWNSKKSDILSGGQMLEELVKYVPVSEKRTKVKRLVEIWKQYHLNDLQAGTVRQTEALEKAGISGYNESVAHLKLIDLYDDNGYKYGHGWLYQPVPGNILTEIKELAGSFPEFSRYAKGGTVELPTTLSESELSDATYAKGGVAQKILNNEANQYSENRLPFRANNLEGKTLDNGDYVVLSFGHYPIWYYNAKEGKWYGNITEVSKTTALQKSASRPDWNAEMLTHEALTKKMMEEDARYDLGGAMLKDLTQGPVADNTLGAHAGTRNTENI